MSDWVYYGCNLAIIYALCYSLFVDWLAKRHEIIRVVMVFRMSHG